MHSKKKICMILIGLFFLVGLSVCGILIYQINQVYPEPKEVVCNEGESFIYKGLTVTVKGVEIYQKEEFLEAYPDFEESLNYEYELGKLADSHYMVSNIVIKNNTNETISIGKESVTSWRIECGKNGMSTNGVSLDIFMLLNPNYSSTFAAGQEMEIQLPFDIWETYLSWKDLTENDIKIVYSYYPTKNYIRYQE